MGRGGSGRRPVLDCELRSSVAGGAMATETGFARWLEKEAGTKSDATALSCLFGDGS